MISKKISAVAMLAILVLLTVSCLFRAWTAGIRLDSGDEALTAVERIESFLSRAFPLSRPLSSLRVNLGYRLGLREQDGVFIGEHRLIENIAPPVDRYVNKNTDAIIDFAQRQNVGVYMMLIPTASAVLQSETPHFADANIYNQKQFIEERYLSFAGKLSCVDVYSTLRENSDKSIYFNTESLLTMQGGFFVYEVLTRRMGNAAEDGIDRFKIQYLADDYRGSLTDRVEYKNIAPDVLSTYHYSGTSREFVVRQHAADGAVREYNTLYPTFLLDLGRPLDIYLGGVSPVVEIRQKQSSRGNLLVFGDGWMRTVLPFLACDYGRVTLVDLSQATSRQISDLDFTAYSEILFAYSTDTFMHSDAPSRVSSY